MRAKLENRKEEATEKKGRCWESHSSSGDSWSAQESPCSRGSGSCSRAAEDPSGTKANLILWVGLRGPSGALTAE